jgi:GNAT superfamily N-acetyltransferase
MLERPEVWGDPELGCMLELRELATDRAVRGHGVGLQLALASREVAADVGAPAFKIDCTSHYRFWSHLHFSTTSTSFQTECKLVDPLQISWNKHTISLLSTNLSHEQ